MQVPAIHHAVITVTDVEASLRFYRDGLGLAVLQDREVEGDWPALFGAPSTRLRAIFLGNPAVPDLQAGVLELNAFETDAPGPPTSTFHAGLTMLSYFVDVDETLARLAELGFTEPASPRRPVHARRHRHHRRRARSRRGRDPPHPRFDHPPGRHPERDLSEMASVRIRH